MESLVRWCLKNKSVVILATVLLVGSGAYATARLNQELLPDISFPIITISTPVVGAGPDVVDEQVTQPVESAISGVPEIEALESTSSAGFSVVVVEFDLDADTEEAEADLQSALDGIGLPSQAGEPEVRSQSASEFPILSLSLAASDRDLADLTEYAEDEVVPSIEEVEGVASVDLIGGAEKRVEVELDDHDGEPLGGGGLDGLYLGHPAYGALDRLGDLLVHHIGPRPHHGGRDGYDRERYVGQELLVEARRRVSPAPDEQHSSQDHDGLVLEAPPDDALHQFSSIAALKLSASSLRPLTNARASSSVNPLIALSSGPRRLSTMRRATSCIPGT